MRVLKVFGASLLIIGQLWLSGIVYAGNMTEEMPQQQQMAPQEEVSGNDWVVPISVAVVTGGFGVVTALVVSRRRKG
jgi:hypothetical protein